MATRERSIKSGVAKRRVVLTAVEVFSGLDPAQLWQVLSHPDGAPLFCVDHRHVVKRDGLGLREEEEVVFSAAVRVLWWKTRAKTRVQQCVDASDPEQLTVTFDLLNSDLMSHLTGSWQMRQLQPGPGGQPRTQVTYTFAMWPKGVPAGLRFMPGLLDAVKGAVAREAGQLFDKMHAVTEKVRPGVPVPAALRQVVSEVAQSGGTFKLLQQSKAALQQSKPSLPQSKASLQQSKPSLPQSKASLQLGPRAHRLADVGADDDGDDEEQQQPVPSGLDSTAPTAAPTGATRRKTAAAPAAPGATSIDGRQQSSKRRQWRQRPLPCHGIE